MQGCRYNDASTYKRCDDGFSPNNPNPNHSILKEKSRTYNPPQVKRQFTTNETFNSTYSDATSTQHFLADDKTFFAVGRAIISQLGLGSNRSESALRSQAERSVEIAIELQRILTLKELYDFNQALNIRLRDLPQIPRPDEAQIHTLVRHCENTFGKELRMIMLQQGPISSFFSVDKENTPLSSSNTKGSHHTNNIDLTDHIFYEEVTGKNTSVKEKSLRIKNPTSHNKIIQSRTVSTVQSKDSEAGDEVYSIDLENIHAKGISSSASMNDDNVAKQCVNGQSKIFGRNEIEVIAPANLPENFVFEARKNDELFMVIVPKGGVKKGQVFKSYQIDIDSTSVHEPPGRIKRRIDMDIPMERWRHKLFDCFSYGVLHPMLINSFCCPHVALAQVMARMKLNFTGRRSLDLRSRARATSIMFVPFVIITLNGVFIFLMLRAYYLHLHHISMTFVYSSIAVFALDVGVVIYFYLLVIKTRKTVRQEFNISPSGCGDTATSILCTPCVINQMGQHTIDYETYAGKFWSTTGIVHHIEVKLPSDSIDIEDSV